MDAPFGVNQCFCHHIDLAEDNRYGPNVDWRSGLSQGPPSSVIMAKPMSCAHFPINGSGYLTSREVVMVANVTHEEGDFTVTSDEGKWYRTESACDEWVGGRDGRVVIDYRAQSPAKIQIQWSRLGSWYNSSSGDNSIEPVMFRVPYQMRWAFAEITRRYDSENEAMCGSINDQYPLEISPIRILFQRSHPINTTSHEDASFSSLRKWLDTAISDEDVGSFTGMALIVRAAMSGYLQFDTSTIYVLEASDYFGPEAEPPDPSLRYPYYVGSKNGVTTGCYQPADITFITLGIIAVVTAAVRIWVGPPRLTSWTAQHVYLARIRAISMVELEHFATGYEAAPRNLGSLQAKEYLTVDEDWQIKEGQRSSNPDDPDGSSVTNESRD